MTLKRFALLFSLSFAVLPAFAQQSTTSTPVTKDPQAIAILNQSLNAVGGLAAINSVQDYQGTGNITFYWAGEEIQAAATVQGMGVTNFRIDASVPAGTRTWAVNGASGVLITPDGKRAPAALYNLMTSGSMTLPWVRIASAVTDATTTITYLGLVSQSGQQVHQIHFAPSVLPSTGAPLDGLPNIGSFDVYIAPSTFLIAALMETIHSESNFSVTLPHEIDFANYQTSQNLAVPFAISEKINGQQTWSLVLTSISFNNGLTSAIFNP